MCLVFMSTWVIIPIKRLDEAKSSLRRVFSPDERRRLVLAMLADVINAARQASSISRVAVVSPDRMVLDFAQEYGAMDILEKGIGLNGALKLAIDRSMDLGATSVLIVPGDIPLLRQVDIDRMISMATGQHDVVIAPSNAKGTNALFLRPPGIIELRFGGESFPLHVEEAVRAGVRPRIYRSFTVALDVDEPADLLKVQTLGLGTRTHDFLMSSRKS